MADDKVTVKVDGTSTASLIWVLFAFYLFWTLRDPGCVVKVNGMYYNVRIGDQAEGKP